MPRDPRTDPRPGDVLAIERRMSRIEGPLRDIEWAMRGMSPGSAAALMRRICERLGAWPARDAEVVHVAEEEPAARAAARPGEA